MQFTLGFSDLPDFLKVTLPEFAFAKMIITERRRRVGKGFAFESTLQNLM